MALTALSWVFVVGEPVSALMLAWLILHHRVRLALRFWGAVLVIGLLLHASNHAVMLQEMRAPRTLSWVPIFAAVNGAIWTLFFSALWHRIHRREYPVLRDLWHEAVRGD